MSAREQPVTDAVMVRPIVVPDDFERITAILSSYCTQPVTAECLVEWEEHTPADAIRARMVAVDAGRRVVGYGDCARLPFMLAGSFSVEVAVDPVSRRKGIGSRLFAQTRACALAHRATRLEAEVQDRDPAWHRFAHLCGFHVDRHAIESRLELAQFDEQAFSGVVDAVTQSGIRFFTLAEAGNTAGNQRTLYEMSKRNSFDIPGHEGAFPTFDAYRTAAFQASFFRPEGLFIAAAGDRWIGQTSVSYYVATNSTYTQHTGVDPEYRGRNIALALKLLAIAWGRRIGAAYTRTHNDESNLPILTINRRLGFEPIGGYYRMLCDLSAQGNDLAMHAHR